MENVCVYGSRLERMESAVWVWGATRMYGGRKTHENQGHAVECKPASFVCFWQYLEAAPRYEGPPDSMRSFLRSPATGYSSILPVQIDFHIDHVPPAIFDGSGRF